MPSLLCWDAKKFVFFLDRDGSCTCTRKRLRICDLSNCEQNLEEVRREEMSIVESETGRCER